MTANIASALFDIASQQPNTLAIACPRPRQFPFGTTKYDEITFGELAARVRAVASGLQAAGFNRGDRVVLLVPPSIDFFVLCFALLSAGIVPVVIDPGIGAHNFRSCTSDVSPVGFIGIPKAQVARLLFGWGRKSIRKVVTVGRRVGWGGHTLAQVETMGRRALREIAFAEAKETAAILFTSGSTGAPKGVVYSHANFAAQLEMIGAMFDIERGAVDLPTFPPFALFNPALGVTSIIPDMDATKPGFVDPRKIFGAIDRYQVTTMFGSPALIRRVAGYGVANGITLPRMTRVVSAGAPMPAETLRLVTQMLPATTQVFTPYGATESMPVTKVGSDLLLAETQRLTDAGAGVCVGLPVDGVNVAVIPIDTAVTSSQAWADVAQLGVGEIGEFVVKGQNVTRAYFGRAEATARAKFVDGDAVRHRMGDVGYIDEQGRLWYCGRRSHIVRANGKTYYSVQCEMVFNAHDSVYRTALVEALGKAVLCVEMKPRQDDAVAVLEELAEWANMHTVTRGIALFLVHPGFPVDIRHNAKIFREKLRPWAEMQLKRGQNRYGRRFLSRSGT